MAERTGNPHEEWEEMKQKTNTESVLLQCGYQCARAARHSLSTYKALKPSFISFTSTSTHDAEEDLLGELQVTQLPAYWLSPATRRRPREQASTPQEVEVAIRTLCTPVFTVDADF